MDINGQKMLFRFLTVVCMRSVSLIAGHRKDMENQASE